MAVQVGETGRRPTLLMVNQQPFGHQTGPYYYSFYLRDKYAITYICWDYGLKRVELDSVRVRFVSRDGPKLRRLLRFLLAVRQEIKSGRYDLIFLVYFAGCSLLQIFCRHPRTILNIQTGSERNNVIQRRFENTVLSVESLMFGHIMVISEGLRRLLRLPAARCRILPMGAEPFELPEKRLDGLRLLYVGTLGNRDVHKTIEGFDRFCRESVSPMKPSYVIVGDGPSQYVDQVSRAREQSSCKELITLVGRVPSPELKPYFENATVGVGFIPMTDYFQCQPSIKVFEYLLAGMPVIATRTEEVQKVVGVDNGVLIQDTADDFYEGLKRIARQLDTFDSGRIRNSAREHSWSSIVNTILSPYLKELLAGISPRTVA